MSVEIASAEWSAVVARGGRVVIRAGSQLIAERWRREQGLTPRQVVYASHPHVLHGLGDFAVVSLYGWASHRHAEEMTAILKHAFGRGQYGHWQVIDETHHWTEADWERARALTETTEGLRGRPYVWPSADRPTPTHPTDSSSPDTSRPYFLDLISRIDDVTREGA